VARRASARAGRAAPSPQLVGTAAAATAVTVWGFGNALAKYIALSGPTLSFQRLWLGTALAYSLALATGRKVTRGALRLAVPGGVALGLNSLLFFSAVKYTSVTDATLITTLQPLLILLLVGRTFGERVTRRSGMAAAVAFAGAGLVVLGPGAHGRHGAAGDLLAVGALIAWTAYFVASKRARAHLGTIEYQVVLQLVAALTVTPVALLLHHSLAGSASTWPWVLLLATVPGGGHYLVNYAHRYVRLSVTSLLNLVQPVAAMVAAALLDHERITGVQILGTAVVLAGLVAVLTDRRSHAPDTELVAEP
jgi:drug/metabolite transporter (DMT)-like permease